LLSCSYRDSRDLHPFPTRRSSDLALARETYVEALAAATFAGRLGGDVGLEALARAARNAPAAPDPPRPIDVLLDGLSTLITDGRSEEQRLNSSHVKISYAVFCLKK